MKNRLLELLKIDSTSGREGDLALYIAEHFKSERSVSEFQVAGEGIYNLFIRWGAPEIIFCTHLDTVPPYISPETDGDIIKGRGSCDAKGQIVSMFQACMELEKEGADNFGLLLLAGEETGSAGARIANNLINGSKYVIVGEPTENKVITAGKGTKLFKVEIRGRSAHSGYPDLGVDAVKITNEFFNILNSAEFPDDPILGVTTWNVGRLNSDNAHNVVPDYVSFKIYFRTTFVTDTTLSAMLANVASELNKKFRGSNITVIQAGGDSPIRFYAPEGFEYNIVSFGTDAPALANLGERLLYGPGSIRYAHTSDEQITLGEMEKAVEDYKKMFYKLSK